MKESLTIRDAENSLVFVLKPGSAGGAVDQRSLPTSILRTFSCASSLVLVFFSLLRWFFSDFVHNVRFLLWYKTPIDKSVIR